MRVDWSILDACRSIARILEALSADIDADEIGTAVATRVACTLGADQVTA